MRVYKTRQKKFAGTDFHEVRKKSYGFYLDLKQKTKRRPYVRSAYFKKEKIFIDLFWHHLFEKKNARDRMRRMRYFGCAVDLIEKSTYAPSVKENPNQKAEKLYRFCGITADNELFYVQIKEDRKSNQRFLLSVFPEQ